MPHRFGTLEPDSAGFVLLALAMTLSSLPASATTFEGISPLLTLRGAGTFGWEIDSLADIDGDGIDEIIVPSPFLNQSLGRVQVFSGRTGAELHRWEGNVAGAQFGYSVDDVGDVDLDGYNDIGVGAQAESGTGAAYVYSGRTGELLVRLQGSAGQRFGSRIASAGNIDGTGGAEFMVGSTGSGSVAGRVDIFTLGSNQPLRSWQSNSLGDRFGAGLALGGDLDGDRKADVIVAAPGRGTASLFSALTGATLQTFTSPAGAGAFGEFFVSDAGDFNGDGIEDVCVGDYAALGNAGRAAVFSGSNGALIWELRGAAGAGLGPGRAVRDLNGDGLGDLLLGHYTSSAGASGAGLVTIHTGPDGANVQSLTNIEPGQQFGYDVAPFSDVNGDGAPELLVSAANANQVELMPGTISHGSALRNPSPWMNGLWYDPSHSGEGFVVERIDDATSAVYWFTFDAAGAPRYLLGVGHSEGPRIVVDALLNTSGGRALGNFASADVALASEARLVLSFDGCNQGWAEYTVDGERGGQRLQRLTAVPGVGCDSNDPPVESARFSGSWFRPESSGEGWILQAHAADQYSLLWFSYDDTGAQRWFIGSGQIVDQVIQFDQVLGARGGRFGRYFDPQEVQLTPWGNLRFEFNGCDDASLSWETGDASGALSLKRLTGLQGLACEAGP